MNTFIVILVKIYIDSSYLICTTVLHTHRMSPSGTDAILFTVFVNNKNLPPVPVADGLRKTVTVLFFFNGGRQTKMATYCSTTVLSQSGMSPWEELNWI